MATTYEPIATYTATGSVATYTFSSIPSTYTDIVAVLNTGNGSNSQVRTRFNSDSATNYSRTVLRGSGTAASSFRESSQTYFQLDAEGSSSNALQQTVIVQFNNYSNTTTFKTMLSRANNASYGVDAIVGLWRSTSAITSIEFFNSNASNWIAGSTFTLYGIKAA